jgi:formamidopyrimidine-DNA glycosylase
MPELPEVEMVARSLAPLIEGRTVTAVWTSGFGLRMRRPVDLEALRTLTVGRRLMGTSRVGKQLIVNVAGGNEVLIHLGMTGKLSVDAATAPRALHTHVAWTFRDGREMRFVDPRRFGWVEGVAAENASQWRQELGADPLRELGEKQLAELLRRSRAPLKAFLLDQGKIAGLGNIYVCEALFRARLHPKRPAHQAARQAARLLEAIREALEQGLANRGTTLRDYVDAEGRRGDNARALLVYGREGEPCRVCEGAIKRQVQAGRSTFFCSVCQRR